jgi:hypothetical protein
MQNLHIVGTVLDSRAVRPILYLALATCIQGCSIISWAVSSYEAKTGSEDSPASVTASADANRPQSGSPDAELKRPVQEARLAGLNAAGTAGGVSARETEPQTPARGSEEDDEDEAATAQSGVAPPNLSISQSTTQRLGDAPSGGPSPVQLAASAGELSRSNEPMMPAQALRLLPTESALPSGHFALRAGAYRDEVDAYSNAASLRDLLSSAGSTGKDDPAIRVVKYSKTYLVLVGDLPDLRSARALAARMKTLVNMQMAVYRNFPVELVRNAR